MPSAERPPRVLIADDDSQNAELLEVYLAGTDYELRTAANGEETMRQVYLIPNIITASALSCGLFVIFKVNMVEPGSGLFHVLNVSALLLLVAAFADLLDGAVARAIGAESEFGVIFDSLADAVGCRYGPLWC